ncbi:MAG: ATP-binding protein [Elusimicrobia bacterium]|nr:ATP-binding protein [Elusimicrobiota bacterium]
MEKWAIEAVPTEKDPCRYALLFKGDLKDILAVIREFGSKCGRPRRTDSSEGFNFQLFISYLDQVELGKLTGMLTELAPGKGPAPQAQPELPAPLPASAVETQIQAQPPQPAPTPVPAPAPAPELPVLTPPPTMVQFPESQTPPAQAPAPLPFGFPSQAEPAPAPLPASAMETQIQTQPPQPAPAPAPTPAPAPAPELPVLTPPPTVAQPPAPLPFGFPSQPVVPAPVIEQLPLTQPTDAAEPVKTAPVAVPSSPQPFLAGPELPALAGQTLAAQAPAPAPTPTPTGGRAPMPPTPGAPPPGPPLLSPEAMSSPGSGAAAAPPAPASAQPPAQAAPAGQPGSALAPAVSLTRPGRTPKPLWGVGMGLEEKTDLENILVGPFNRFSHAAAASVVGAPGNMYNPLFIFGPSGVGKSHMIRAIGTGLEKALGGGVLLTSGVRLAHAVGRSLEEGKYPELEKRFADSKALLVDDLHLLNVTDENKASLAKIFALFFSRSLQVVLTSFYPARALGSLEESLKISLRKGWSVDMKLASGESQKDMVLSSFSRHKAELTNDEVGLFVTRLGKNYAELSRWTRRFVTLRSLLEAQDVPASFDKVLQLLFPGDPAEDAKEIPTAQEVEAVRQKPAPAPGADPLNLAFVFPKGTEAFASFVSDRFYDCAAKNRIAASYKHVLFGSYDADQPLGVPFQIGEMCRKAGADAALVVGPPSSSKLTARLGEFSHAVGHILEGIEVPFAWIPYDGMKVPGNFLRAHLDFMARLE